MKIILLILGILTIPAFAQTSNTAAELCAPGKFKRACSSVIAHPSNPSHPTIAHRTFGTAPLVVHFDSGAEDHKFHDRFYLWDFGDTGSGNFSTNSKSKNTDTGAIAAHVYETPGTYTATLTVRDATGVIDTKSTTITVSNADNVFSGSNTTCVSATADFAGCPTGGNGVTITGDAYPAIHNLILSNRRILFKRGDTFTLSSRDLKTVSNVHIAAFGTCTNPDARGICSNAPVILNTHVDRHTFTFQVGSQDISIYDLDLRANGEFNGSMSFAGAENVLAHKLKVSINGSFLGSDVNYAALSDSDVSGGGATIYIFGKRIIILGSDIYDNTGQFGHVIRFPIINRSVMTHNRVSGTFSQAQHLVKLHGLRPATRQNYVSSGASVYETEYVHIANNLFGRGSGLAVAIAPQNSSYPEPISNIVFEKNRYDYTYGSAVTSSHGTLLSIEATNVTVRNNIFDSAGGPEDIGPRIVDVKNLGPSQNPYDVKIYNNTFLATDKNYNQFDYIGIRICAECETTVVNNLMSRPVVNGINHVGILDNSTESTQSNNLFTTSAGIVDEANDDFRITSSSPANDAGIVVPVFDTYEGTLRTGTYDLGAGGVQ